MQTIFNLVMIFNMICIVVSMIFLFILKNKKKVVHRQ